MLEADQQDSAWPADVMAAKATMSVDRAPLASPSAVEAAPERLEDWGSKAVARQARRASHRYARQEISEHRPYPLEAAVSVPIKSDRAGEAASAGRESLNLWELLSKCQLK